MWINIVKYQTNDTLNGCKARLALKGYAQTYGTEEIFVPATKNNTIRIIIFLAAHFCWELQQFDVKNIFL